MFTRRYGILFGMVLHSGSLKGMELIYLRTGIIHQARLPLGHVLLLSLFDDRGLNSR